MDHDHEDLTSEQNQAHLWRSLYADAAAKFADEDDNSKKVKDEFYFLAVQAIGDGTLTIPRPDLLLIDSAWARENSAAGRRLMPLLKELVTGQLSFDGVLQTMKLGVGIGSRKKTTFALLTRPDLLIAWQERLDNAEKMQAAIQRDEPMVQQALDWIDTFGTLPAAWQAGVVPFEED